jgi:GH24 family phage-related lysozyme (muramidase)
MARRYLCPAGKPTIGYGHVIQDHEAHLNTATLTQAQASALLQQDVDKQYGAHVAKRVHRDVTQTMPWCRCASTSAPRASTSRAC